MSPFCLAAVKERKGSEGKKGKEGKGEGRKKKGQGAPAYAGGELRMRESHERRPSQSPRPRVMRVVG